MPGLPVGHCPQAILLIIASQALIALLPWREIVYAQAFAVATDFWLAEWVNSGALLLGRRSFADHLSRSGRRK